VRKFLACAFVSVLALQAGAAEPDRDMINRISDAEFNHGEVMDLAEYLADRIGGRMTNSPAMRLAEKWTQEKFRSWGLSNVHLEGYEFGRGWWIEQASAHLVAPRPIDLKEIPLAWTPPTQGTLRAPIIVAPMKHERDFAEWKGKLAGKIVLVTYPAPQKDESESPFKRLEDADLGKASKYVEPHYDPEALEKQFENFPFQKKLDAFLASEGAVAIVKMSRLENRLVHGDQWWGYKPGRGPLLPAAEMAAEDYRMLTRLAKAGEVILELNHNVHYEDGDTKANDVLAEIPGKDPKAGFVMAGAHLDSWVAGTGAADNGAGSVVVMEAARILASLNVRAKRAIRFALWSGEEQGLLGSNAWIEKHLAKRPPATDPDIGPFVHYMRPAFPITPQPEFGELAAYFNLDNGSGKIRGIYTENNLAVAPIFTQWLAPFASMGASTVSAQSTGGTDHLYMARIGLPAFQFIQDPLDYGARVHHSDLDVYDHLRADDLRQAAVIMASFLYMAANADEPLPHNVLPTQPKASDPFAYKDPAD
jgi:carboxypeptidase Q